MPTAGKKMHPALLLESHDPQLGCPSVEALVPDELNEIVGVKTPRVVGRPAQEGFDVSVDLRTDRLQIPTSLLVTKGHTSSVSSGRTSSWTAPTQRDRGPTSSRLLLAGRQG